MSVFATSGNRDSLNASEASRYWDSIDILPVRSTAGGSCVEVQSVPINSVALRKFISNVLRVHLWYMGG